MTDGIGIESDAVEPAPIPAFDRDARRLDDIGEAERLPEEDVEAEDDVRWEAEGDDIPDDAQPESQGEDPLLAALGEDGNGDLAPEDE